MKLTINVRPQEDDSTNMCTLCPVAQALREAVGLERGTPQTATRFDAFAQPSRLYAMSGKLLIQCDAPPDVAEKIKHWDATGEMEPFTFEVDAVAVVRGKTFRPPVEFIMPGATPPSQRPGARIGAAP